MTRKKKIVITIVSALVAVLVLGVVAFTIYRNVQIERLRAFIVDSLLEQDGKSYSLSDRKELYDAIEVRAVYWNDERSYTEYLLETNSQFRDSMSDDKFRSYYYADIDVSSYAVVVYFNEMELSNGNSVQGGYYKCGVGMYNDKWYVLPDGPYINVSECTPTEFVRRIL